MGSLTEAVKKAGSPVELLRNSTASPQVVPIEVPREYTNWESEQLAWHTTCGLLDQSHHMVTITLEGPDLVPFLARIGINTFANFGVNRAKQLVACSPEGFLIGQGILFRISEEKAMLVGPWGVMDWVEYQHAITPNRLRFRREGTSFSRAGDPEYFRYEVQGPTAPDVVRDLLGGELPELGFFHMSQASVDGREITFLRHGMVGQPGYEIFGKWEDKDVVTRALLAAGEKHGMTRTGAYAYFTTAVYSGYLPGVLPAVYTSPELADYRDWLSDRSFEATAPLGGSFFSDDVEDYYLTPFALGYDRALKFDHDFIGREALQRMVDDGVPARKKKVTLIWNPDDVASIYRSWFDEGENAKMLQLPGGPGYTTFRYDSVRADGVHVGTSGYPGAASIYRKVLSVAILDSEYAVEGRELTLLWGEEPNSGKARVESHRQKEIRVTVAPAPFSDYARTDYRTKA